VVTFGSVKEKEFKLIEQGEYVLTLNELEESTGQWGDRMIWKFLVAPKEDPTGYMCKDNGDEYTLWAFTDADIVIGSMGHEFAQTLTGRKLEKDDEPPSEDDLIGKRLIAYVTHETPARGKSAGKKREAIVAGSIKPFKGPGKKIAPNAPARPDPTAEDTARAEAQTRVESLIGRAVKLGTPRHLEYMAIDLETADREQLLMLAATIQEEVMAALDA
jgi:hypothetical protein